MNPLSSPGAPPNGPPPAQPLPNGTSGGNGASNPSQMRLWPNTGDQMDMNRLWDLVNNLAEVQQGIREQTAGVLQRVQMIQASNGTDHHRPAESNGVGATTTTTTTATATTEETSDHATDRENK